jgi:hypothetical protein
MAVGGTSPSAQYILDIDLVAVSTSSCADGKAVDIELTAVW